MKEGDLRKLHRRIGITLALFIALQTATGLMMSLGLLPTWYGIFGFLHYGAGVGGYVYRIFLGIGMLGAVLSGTLIFFRMTARSSKG